MVVKHPTIPMAHMKKIILLTTRNKGGEGKRRELFGLE